jgi:hypothetical protein
MRERNLKILFGKNAIKIYHLIISALEYALK